jgi:hypothetical protein
VLSALLLAIGTSLMGCQTTTSYPVEKPVLVEGVVWQLDHQTTQIKGNWNEIGAKTLLVQWIAVDGIQFMHGSENELAAKVPDWERISAEPWATEVILGLAGRFDETSARANVADLVTESTRLAQLPTPLKIVGWYFPVEVDGSWKDAEKLAPLLAKLPRPLWISVYDNQNIGAVHFAAWLDAWLPKDIGVFFQDGVGVHARSAEVARQYADVLTKSLGSKRLKVIAEAFRPLKEGGFRSASVDELLPQLLSYRGLPVYLFDGPHYVSPMLVDDIRKVLGH